MRVSSMKSMPIEIKTLTPIWTGGVKGECDILHETGIIGSMRWWYEAIVRGMGGYACDPTSDGNAKIPKRCELDDKNFKKSLESGKSVQDALDEQICLVCQLFGCTGWRRRFRIEIEKVETINLNFINKLDDIDVGWWIGTTLKKNPKAFFSSNTMMLKLISEDKEIENKILILLKSIESIGSFGAKSQNGFGIIKYVSDKEFRKSMISDEVIRYKKKNPDKSNQSEFRTLKDLYKFPLKIKSMDEMMKYFGGEQKTQDYMLTGFTLKYFLRKRIKEFDNNKISMLVINFNEIENLIKNKYPIEKYNKVSKIVARTLFGSDIKEEDSKWASLIDISHTYKKDGKYQFRVVCFLPEIVTYDDIVIKFDISSIIDVIQDLLKDALGNSIEIGETWSGMEIFNNLFED